jgi:cytochrome c553
LPVRLAIVLLLLSTMVAPALAQTVDERLSICLACHGESGVSMKENVPSLGGQPAAYLLIQLNQFREKRRRSEIMKAMANGLTDDDLRTLVDRLAKLTPPPATGPALTEPELAQSRDLVAKYRCASCHQADFSGHDQIPHLAGQREDYLVRSLRAYKSNRRPGYDPAMNEAMQAVRETDIPTLARYVSRFRP